MSTHESSWTKYLKEKKTLVIVFGIIWIASVSLALIGPLFYHIYSDKIIKKTEIGYWILVALILTVIIYLVARATIQSFCTTAKIFQKIECTLFEAKRRKQIEEIDNPYSIEYADDRTERNTDLE